MIGHNNNNKDLQSVIPHKNDYALGWIPDTPDFRDHYYSVPDPVIERGLPKFVDMRDKCPTTIYNQGQIGSCTANAIAAAIEFDRLKQGLQDWTPSRLFIYYNERDIEGTINSDSGAMIRDGIKSINDKGAPTEDLWPYDVTRFTIQPSNDAYVEAKKHLALSYQRIDNDLVTMKGCLASGYPFVFGFSVYESMMSYDVASTGILNMPLPSEKLIGGHAVLACGFDDSTQRFTIRNSWGKEWGNGGYFTMPYEYLTNTNLCDDRWSVRIVT
jgi:C1A family cysteine protease